MNVGRAALDQRPVDQTRHLIQRGPPGSLIGTERQDLLANPPTGHPWHSPLPSTISSESQ
jgi:hypothetical protein